MHINKFIELANIGSLILESFDAEKGGVLIVSGSNRSFFAKYMLQHPNTSLGKVVLDLHGKYREKSLQDTRVCLLGVNSSMDLIELLNLKEDVFSNVNFIATLTQAIFNLRILETLILYKTLIRLAKSKSFSLDKLIEEAEGVIINEGYDVRIRERIINIVQFLFGGRTGAALSGINTFDSGDIERGCIVDFSGIPYKSRLLTYSLVLYYIVGKYEKTILMADDFDELIPYFHYLEDVFVKSRYGRYFILLCKSYYNVAKAIRAADLIGVLLGGTLDVDTIRYVKGVFNLNTKDILALHFLCQGCFMYLSKRGIFRVNIGELEEYMEEIEVERIIKPEVYHKKPILIRLFKDSAMVVCDLLEFLREGPSNREGIFSYLQYKHGLGVKVAMRLLMKMLLYKLVEEVIGKDGRYWIKITVNGLLALEEFLEYRGLGGGNNSD